MIKRRFGFDLGGAPNEAPRKNAGAVIAPAKALIALRLFILSLLAECSNFAFRYPHWHWLPSQRKPSSPCFQA